jgi:iron complex outermembrane receptor protein
MIRNLTACGIGAAVLCAMGTMRVGADPAAAAATTATTAPAAASDSDTLTEIVVQAQRRSENLQSVPIAVTPISAEDLATHKLNDLATLTLAAPSLQITTDNAFTLRGIGSQIFVAQVDSSVGVSVDDVSLGVPLFMSNGIFNDIAQIAVLDGPQGLLFGRNSSAGLLQIISNKPVIGQFSGDAGLEYDDRDTAPGGHFGGVAKATVNIPVSSDSALRINILESYQDPIVKAAVDTSPDLEQDQKRLGLKAKYLWTPSDDTQVYLIADYSRERGIGGIWDRSWLTVDPKGYIAAGVAKDGVTPGPDNLYYGVDAPDYRSVDTGGVSLNVSQRLSSALTLSNILAWRRFTLGLWLDSDYTSADRVDTNTDNQTYNQISDELRLALDLGKLDGQVGFYTFSSFDHNQSLIEGTLGAPIPILGGDVVSANFDHSYAVFGQFNYHVDDALRLLAGARETYDTVAMHNLEDEGNYPVPLDGPTGAFAYSHSNRNFSFKVGAEYELVPGSMLYLNYGTGYKGPAYPTNLAFAGQDPYILPETVHDVEGGIKTMLLDDKLRLNISGFYEKFTNFQTQTFTTNAIPYTGNAGGARSAGVEFNITARPIKDFTVNLGLTYADSVFTDNITSCYNGQSAASCPNGTDFQAAGAQTPSSAKLTSTLEGLYDFHIGTNTLTVEANWYHRSSMNFQANGDPATETGAIDLLGANLTYRLEQTDLAVFCKNCTNKIFPSFLGPQPGDGAAINQSFSYNSVRTIGASVNYKF